MNTLGYTTEPICTFFLFTVALEEIKVTKFFLNFLKVNLLNFISSVTNNKPIFLLKPADGAIGAHYQAVQRCFVDFKMLTEKIIERSISLTD